VKLDQRVRGSRGWARKLLRAADGVEALEAAGETLAAASMCDALAVRDGLPVRWVWWRAPRVWCLSVGGGRDPIEVTLPDLSVAAGVAMGLWDPDGAGRVVAARPVLVEAGVADV
jgi:hypothetical protein